MKKNVLNNFLSIIITIICLGIISGCGDDGGGSSGGGCEECSETVINNAPTANDMSIITDMDLQAAITLTASDPDGDSLVWHINSIPSHGTLTGTVPDLTYSPESGYFGSDSFTFYVDDYAEYSNTATVTILVKSKNILFVDIAASGIGDGSSWENAFNHPQDAVNAASAGEQVWVAKGTYYSQDNDPAIPVLQMKEEVLIYGGFSGSESNLTDRDYENNNCILDGNNGVYHVVIGAVNALIDGFTITKGNANGSNYPEYHGGGMYNSHSSLYVSNCILTYNYSNYDGAGMYNTYCSPKISNCTFSNNTAIIDSNKTNGGGGSIYNWHASPSITECVFKDNQSMEGAGGSNGGGAIYNNDCSPTIKDCIFSGNSSYNDYGSGGGSIFNSGGSPKISDCVFEDNTAYSGGAVYNNSSYAKISNCSFIGNEASSSGGAFYNYIYSNGNSPVIKNCCIYGNKAVYGGGIYNYNCSPVISNCTLSGNSASSYGGGLFNYSSSEPNIVNCIIWGNSASLGNEDDDEMTNNISSSPVISYSDINIASYAGSDGNIQSDPLFINGPLGNYYLSHIAAGQAVDSPCVDAGSDTAENLDLVEYTTRIDGGFDTGIVDMGYHYEP